MPGLGELGGLTQPGKSEGELFAGSSVRICVDPSNDPQICQQFASLAVDVSLH